MKGLSLLLAGTTMFGGFARLDAVDTDLSKGKDDFDYVFESDNGFEKTNGDEFEVLDAEHGGRSGFESVSNDGNKTIIKAPSEYPAISYDSIRGQKSSVLYTSAYTDAFEGNDSFATATNVYSAGQDAEGIYQHSVWLDATISQKTSGWWLWEKKYVDKDFYSFDAVCYGTLTVPLTNIPKSCDYDLRAYKLADGPKTKAEDLSFDKYLQTSAYGSNHDEKITLSVTPGTYYFCVYSYQDKTYDNDDPYHLLFEEKVDTSRENTRYWISTGKSNGDLGAIWVSDYKPLGYTPVTLKDSNAVVKVMNYESYPYIRHLADRYAGDNYINYAVIFVWDPATRACISAWAQQLVEIVNSQTDWQDSQAKSVNIGMGTAGLVLTVAGIAIGTASTIITGGLAGAALTAAGIIVNSASLPVSLASFAMSFHSNAPYLATKKDLLAYLVSVQQTFAVGKGSNSNETKLLRFRYRFDKDSHSLNWSPFYSASDYNFYNENYISFQIKHSGIDGTIRGFKLESDLQSYLER